MSKWFSDTEARLGFHGSHADVRGTDADIDRLARNASLGAFGKVTVTSGGHTDTYEHGRKKGEDLFDALSKL